MRKYLFYICILILNFIIVGCSSESDMSPKDDNVTVQDKMNNIIEEDNYVIVDVRTEEEYNESHVVESINIPYDVIDENVEIDKDKTVMVYCRSGKRSAIAYEMLTSLGYDVLDLGAYDDISLDKE